MAGRNSYNNTNSYIGAKRRSVNRRESRDEDRRQFPITRRGFYQTILRGVTRDRCQRRLPADGLLYFRNLCRRRLASVIHRCVIPDVVCIQFVVKRVLRNDIGIQCTESPMHRLASRSYERPTRAHMCHRNIAIQRLFATLEPCNVLFPRMRLIEVFDAREGDGGESMFLAG